MLLSALGERRLSREDDVRPALRLVRLFAVDKANTTPFAITTGSGPSMSPEIHDASSVGGATLLSALILKAMMQPSRFGPVVIENFGVPLETGPQIGT